MQVPFDQVDGRIYVQARVNGRGPFRFAVDTGASGVGRADSSLVAALDLPLLAPTANSDGLAIAPADTTRLDSLDVGGLVHADVEVITRDYSGGLSAQAALDGIIARGFFADGLLIIDYRRRIVAFSRTLALAPGQDGVLTYARPFRVPVTIAGVQAQGNLDTGADVAFVLPRAVFEQVGGTPLQAAGRGQLANGRIETWRSTVPGPFRIGLARLADVEVRVVERFPEVLVGAHALQGLAVLIDQRSNSVALCP
jgi:predicted aspartyl protease